MWSLAIPLGFEWVLLMSILAIFGLTPSKKLVDYPRLGIFLWFAIAASSFIGVALIVFSTLLLASQHMLNQDSFAGDNWVYRVIWAFVPWLLLAIGGISTSLLALEIEPVRESELEFSKLLGLGLTTDPRGFSVLQTQIGTAFTARIEGKTKIVITSGLLRQLSPPELDVVLRHEQVHFQRKHPILLKLAIFVKLLSWRVPLGTQMVQQVERLTEFVADDAVAAVFGAEFVTQTLLKFGLDITAERITRLKRKVVRPTTGPF